MKTDEELMLEYKNGSELAFQNLYNRHSATVYSYLHKRLNSQSACDDIFQSVFLKLHKTRTRYDLEVPFLAWIFTITRSALIDYFRKQKRNLETSNTKMIETVSLSQDAKTHEIEITSVPERYQSVLRMRFFENMSFDEIAKKLSTSSSNARQLTSRAIRMLKKTFSGKLE